MKILVSGSTGFVGAALVDRLKEEGHQPVRLVRSIGGYGEPEVMWNPSADAIDGSVFEGVDAVVHLAGENIAARWNPEKKRKIRESRVNGTRLIARGILHATPPPGVLVSASAIGYYGDRGDEWLDEAGAPGDTFLADVCEAWEAESRPAADKGTRVVNLRFGAILSGDGGALKKMLPLFKMGVGGMVGSGEQYMSWVALEDATRAILFALTHEELEGPVNVVSPNPVTNRTFTKTLGDALGRPTMFPVPAFAAHALFGEMADDVLLASARVRPAKLQAAGFKFEHPDLGECLRHALRE
jgi:hypothetical protein